MRGIERYRNLKNFFQKQIKLLNRAYLRPGFQFSSRQIF